MVNSCPGPSRWWTSSKPTVLSVMTVMKAASSQPHPSIPTYPAVATNDSTARRENGPAQPVQDKAGQTALG